MKERIKTITAKMPFTKADFYQAATNTVTDTGFLFEIGNAAIGFAASPRAGFISLGVAALCITSRATYEMRKIGIDFNLKDAYTNALQQHNNIAQKALIHSAAPIMKTIDLMSKNAGVSLMISGSALIAAAAFAGFENMDAANTLTFPKEAFILGCFGLANFFRGYARDLQENGIGQRLLDVSGIALAATGVILTGQAFDMGGLTNLETQSLVDTAVKGTFIGAAGMAAYQAIKAIPSHKLFQPDLMFAAGCFGNAAISSSPETTFANIVFGLAFIALDGLKKSGGLYENLTYNPKRDNVSPK